MMRFLPDVHTAIWGRENWLVSVREDAPSFFSDHSGRTLRDFCPDFPLLVKTIDAEKRLSVQVHPNDETAKTVGGEAKTEMWCVLRSGPIFAGFRPGVTKNDVERAVADGSFEELMMRFDAQPGQCFFIPGGLVHAIGEGTKVYEVQQSSNTTFRLYDWGRVGADGKPRQLHVREALAAMSTDQTPPVPSDGVACPYFNFYQMHAGAVPVAPAWRVVYCPETDETTLLEPNETHSVTSHALVTIV